MTAEKSRRSNAAKPRDTAGTRDPMDNGRPPRASASITAVRASSTRIAAGHDVRQCYMHIGKGQAGAQKHGGYAQVVQTSATRQHCADARQAPSATETG